MHKWRQKQFRNSGDSNRNETSVNGGARGRGVGHVAYSYIAVRKSSVLAGAALELYRGTRRDAERDAMRDEMRAGSRISEPPPG